MENILLYLNPFSIYKNFNQRNTDLKFETHMINLNLESYIEDIDEDKYMVCEIQSIPNYKNTNDINILNLPIFKEISTTVEKKIPVSKEAFSISSNSINSGIKSHLRSSYLGNSNISLNNTNNELVLSLDNFKTNIQMVLMDMNNNKIKNINNSNWNPLKGELAVSNNQGIFLLSLNNDGNIAFKDFINLRNIVSQCYSANGRYLYCLFNNGGSFCVINLIKDNDIENSIKFPESQFDNIIPAKDFTIIYNQTKVIVFNNITFNFEYYNNFSGIIKSVHIINNKVLIFTNYKGLTLYVLFRKKYYTKSNDAEFDLNCLENNFIFSKKIYNFNIDGSNISKIIINNSGIRLGFILSVKKRNIVLLMKTDFEEELDFKFRIIGVVAQSSEILDIEFCNYLLKENEYLICLWSNNKISKCLINNNELIV